MTGQIIAPQVLMPIMNGAHPPSSLLTLKPPDASRAINTDTTAHDAIVESCGL
jgi:hypothetical protein